jgi:integrase
MTGSPRAPKGSVSIESRKGRLRLHLPKVLYDGKNKYLSLGLSDIPINRKFAEQTASQIKFDISTGGFDPTLEKYRNKEYLKGEKTLSELWSKYVAFKSKQWSPSTQVIQITTVSNDIQKLPTQDLNDAAKIRDYIVERKTVDGARRLLTQLNACCKWAHKSRLIGTPSPFEEFALEIQKPTGDGDEDWTPFTREQRDAIIQAFRNDSFSRYKGKHSQYAPYVEFCFLTGCRSSEAIGLRWKDVEENVIRFQRSVIYCNGIGPVEKEGLKTQRKRKFPINNQLRNFLNLLQPETYNSSCSNLVFPVNGTYINQKVFRAGVWKSVLTGLRIDYRKPYEMRHTYITLQLAAGASKDHIAAWCGTSTQMIDRHYAGDLSQVKPLEV